MNDHLQNGGENPPFSLINVIDSQSEIIDHQNRVINRLAIENEQLKNWIKLNIEKE